MTRSPYSHLIIAGVLLVAVLGAYAFWYRHVGTVSARASQLAGEVATLGDVSGRASSVRRDLEEVARQEADLYAHLVGTDTIVTYLEAIEATGSALGATVEVVSVGNATARAGQANQLQMALRITGSFDAVMRTLGAIEYQPYATTLASVTLDTPDTGSAWTAAATFLVGTPPNP